MWFDKVLLPYTAPNMVEPNCACVTHIASRVSQTSHQAYEDFNEICFQFLFYTTDQFSEAFAISLPDSQHVQRDVAENDLGGPGGKSKNK